MNVLALLILYNIIAHAASLNGRGLTPLDSASFEKTEPNHSSNVMMKHSNYDCAISPVQSAISMASVNGNAWIELSEHPQIVLHDQITSKFKATLIKFDKYFPYGPAHDEFVKVAVSAVDDMDFLVAEVGVKDYGDFDNEDLLLRFNISKEKLPAIMLFFPDDRPAVTFTDTISAPALRRFCRRLAAWPLPGALVEFDHLAERFTRADDARRRGELLVRAERLLDEAGPGQRDQAHYYLKVMRRVATDGVGFVDTERRRLRSILSGKLAEQKVRDMEGRLNVLESFSPPPVDGKDEL